MKQNYKIYLCALLLVGAVNTMTIGALGADKPTLAVLVVGMGSDTKSDDFAARLGSDLNRDGEYTLVTKDNDAVASMLTTLRAAHTPSTPVDTTGLAAWGRQNGIDMVQLVVESTTAGTIILPAQVERVAQLVDCSTGKLSGRGTYRMNFTLRGTEGVQMVPVAGGVFEMGYKSGRDGSSDTGEKPLHTVKVSNFRIGKYLITQAQWREVMGSLPSELTSNTAYMDDNKPVIYVSHDEIVVKDGFLDKLNALTGKNYRLPTEAEWEYAARGCSAGVCESFQYSGSDTVGDVAYYNQSSGGPTTVGTKNPNGLGIYDMSGNVYEWCRDWYSYSYYTTANNPLNNPENTTPASFRVARGGCWNIKAKFCRVAGRSYFASVRSYVLGFRVVLPAQ
jgi:formylglycine-generating enzyme required for sulfatase activity